MPNVWSNPGVGLPAFILTLDGLEQALNPVLNIDPESVLVSGKKFRDVRAKIRGLSASLEKVEPKFGNIEEMVGQIVRAHEAADQLPNLPIRTWPSTTAWLWCGRAPADPRTRHAYPFACDGARYTTLSTENRQAWRMRRLVVS